MSVRLETERLVLRALRPDDAQVVARLAGRREIAHTTILIPHRYSVEQAQEWIAIHAGQQDGSKETAFGVTMKADGQFIGVVGLREIDTEHSQAEMGFWIGVEWWGNGYAAEAAKTVIAYAFQELKLNRIYAHHMVRNPASGRVLEKIGMKQEGLLRQRVRKWGVFEDVVLMAIIQDDWRPPNMSLADVKTIETALRSSKKT
jgi:[ribosomal protein S5]-alanine N-acetyltransferase